MCTFRAFGEPGGLTVPSVSRDWSTRLMMTKGPRVPESQRVIQSMKTYFTKAKQFINITILFSLIELVLLLV